MRVAVRFRRSEVGLDPTVLVRFAGELFVVLGSAVRVADARRASAVRRLALRRRKVVATGSSRGPGMAGAGVRRHDLVDSSDPAGGLLLKQATTFDRCLRPSSGVGDALARAARRICHAMPLPAGA